MTSSLGHFLIESNVRVASSVELLPRVRDKPAAALDSQCGGGGGSAAGSPARAGIDVERKTARAASTTIRPVSDGIDGEDYPGASRKLFLQCFLHVAGGFFRFFARLPDSFGQLLLHLRNYVLDSL